MRDYIELGPTPGAEDCVQVGHDDYHRLARKECERYKGQLIRQFGNPDRFAIKSFPHDFGSYMEVVVYIDNDSFAYEVDANLPSEWDEIFQEQKPFTVGAMLQSNALAKSRSKTSRLAWEMGLQEDELEMLAEDMGFDLGEL